MFERFVTFRPWSHLTRKLQSVSRGDVTLQPVAIRPVAI